jgi:hypothetical protein
MTPFSLSQNDRLGFIHAAADGQAPGINSLEQLIAERGFQAVTADPSAGIAFGNPENPANAQTILQWIRENGITALEFCYRLDPHEGAGRFALLLALLRRLKLLASQGGPLRALYFAGLPEACQMVRYRHREVTGVFCGEETPAEMLSILGIKEKTAALKG